MEIQIITMPPEKKYQLGSPKAWVINGVIYMGGLVFIFLRSVN